MYGGSSDNNGGLMVPVPQGVKLVTGIFFIVRLD
jgi:hypothetical protein